MVWGKGYNVIVFDALPYAEYQVSLYTVENCDNQHFQKTGICDLAALNILVADFCPERITHLAADIHFDLSIAHAVDFGQTKVLGTSNLFEAVPAYWNEVEVAIKVNFRFVQLSTDEVYGSLDEPRLFRETTSYDSSSPFSAAKAKFDNLAMVWEYTGGLSVVSPSRWSKYEPYHFLEKLILAIILNVLRECLMSVYGMGEYVRDWLFIIYNARNLDIISGAGRTVHDASNVIYATNFDDELDRCEQVSFETDIEKSMPFYPENECSRGPSPDRNHRLRVGLMTAETMEVFA